MLHTVIPAGLLAALLCLVMLPARPGWKLALSFFGGLGCLILLNLLSPLTGMLFELNVLTISVAGGLGLPGVGALLVMHCLLA